MAIVALSYMQINGLEIGIIVLLTIGLIIWLIARNRKDKKAFEKDQLENDIQSPDPEKKV
ncbi:hypothetical protein BC343_24920 [Mucilaginibacter pedocola]|uniref:Uncharacterized protein n=2 Tax=Mucilaginibacter pedocola TaxID=1792845 RepID=A0A1S9PHV5_9SPHI|nr:hypothetical protein BC343_24920 [Mucilaginibacter pedocola]